MRTVQKKICLLGDFAVGKTSLVRRFVEGRFDDKYLSTVGVKISRHAVTRNDYTLNLIIWDLAGGDAFSQLSDTYLRGAAGALVVCDLTRPETLATMADYARDLRQMNPTAALVLAANKADLVEDRRISDDALAAAAAPFGVPHLLTSAKSGAQVAQAFLQLAEQIEASL